MKTRRLSRIAVTVLAVLTLSLFALFYRSDNALTKSGAMALPSLSAVKTGVLDASEGGDVNGNNVINPGDRLKYSVVINNSGSDATGVNFSDTIDGNMTYTNGSIIASPVAVNESYSATGNVSIIIPAASGILANDQNPNTGAACTIGNTCTISSATGSFSSANGGNVTLNADGSFTFNPKAGFEGADTFTYTLANGTGLTDTAIVTINVSGMIWFVNNNAGACASSCDGRLSNPFTTLAGFNTANALSGGLNPDNNDNIFIYESATAYAAPVTLRTGQRLIGQDATASLNTITGITSPAFSAALPATNNGNATLVTITSSGNGVNLSSGNTLRGFTIGNTTGAKLNAAASVGTLTIGPVSPNTSDVTLNGTGQALNLTGGGTLAARFASVSADGGTSGIVLTGIGGNLESPTTNIQNSTGTGISVSNSVVNGIFNFGVTTSNSSAGTGVLLSGNANNLTFAALNITPDANQRALLAQNNTGTITTTSGTISNSGATAVEITQSSGTTPLNVQLTNVSANGGTNGIVLTNTSSSGSPGGFRILGAGSAGSGGTIQNQTQRGAKFNTASNISLSWMTFSGNGTANLDAAATCGDALNQLNTNCAAGIDFQNVTGVSLNNDTITGGAQMGINGKTVSNLTMNNVTVQNAGNEVSEDGVQLTNLTGTCVVSNSTFKNNFHRQFEVQNNSGNLNFTVTSSLFDRVSYVSTSSDGLLFAGKGTAVMTGSIKSSTFKNNFSDGFFGQSFENANVTITLGSDGLSNNPAEGNTFTDNSLMTQIVSDQGSVMKFNGGNNTHTVSPVVTSGSTPVTFRKGTNATGTYSATFGFNTIGSTTAQSGNNCAGCNGISITNEGASGGMKVNVSNNTIQHINQRGIETILQLNDNLVVNVTNNIIRDPDGTVGQAIWGQSNNDSTDNGSLCMDISGNNIGGNWDTGTGLTRNIRVRQASAGGSAAFRIVGVSPATGATAANVQTYLNGANTNAQASATATTSFNGGAGACASSIAFAAPSIFQSDPSNPDLAEADFDFLTNISRAENYAANNCDFNKTTKTENAVTADNSIVHKNITGQSASENHSSFVDEFYNSLTGNLTIISSTISSVSSLVIPTVSAEEQSSGSIAPAVGETITKPLGTIPAGESVTVQLKATINSTPTTFYSVSNTANITADGNISINSTTATNTVVQPASIAKAFGASFIATGGTTSLTYTITNGNSISLSGLSFSDTLPSGLVINTPNGLNNACGGTVTATQNTSAISLSGGAVGANTTCAVRIDVKGTTEGAKTSATNNVGSTSGGSGNTATATVNVIAAPTFTKAFGSPTIQLNSSTSLTFTITNTSTLFSLNNISFTDTLPAGLVVSNPNALSGACGGGTITAVQGSGTVSLSDAVLAANTNCTFSVNVTGTTAGVKNNSATVSTTELGTGATATAWLTVIAPPTIVKAFDPASIVSGGQSVVTLTLTNPNSTGALTNASFSDALTNMTAVGGAAGGTCTGASANNLTAGSINPSFTGLTIPNNGNCTVTFAVTSLAVGVHPNTTSGIITDQTSAAGAASNTVSLTVLAPTDLTITKTHTSSFMQSDTGKTYSITATNSGGSPTSGTVTVTDTLPSGLTATGMSGSGWTCTLATLTCTRSDVLAAGSSYPVITLTVDVAANAPASVTNTASVSGGGETDTNNNTASDPTTIIVTATYTISGKVTNGGEALSGVSVALTGTSTSSITTDASGNYSFTNLGGGTYTVTPSLNGYTFVESSITVTNISTDQPNQNFATSETSYEGDVSARSTGDKTVDIFDMIVTGNIIANQPNTAPLANGGEYQRADAAPRSTKGDGSVDVQDLVVMGLYAAAVNPLTPASGPIAPIPAPSGNLIAGVEDDTPIGRGSAANKEDETSKAAQGIAPVAGSATVSAGTASGSGGNTAIIPIQLTSNNVGGVQFSVTYDATKLSISSDAALTDQAGDTLFTFNNQTPGQLGIVAVKSPFGTAFPASTTLFNINFTVAPGAASGASTIGFGSTPVPVKASDPAGEAATITLTPGTVTVLGTTAAPVSISGRVVRATGRGIRNVQISMIDSQGRIRTTQTTSFGYYRFDNVEAGETITLTAKARRFNFSQSSIIRTTNESITDADFISQQ